MSTLETPTLRLPPLTEEQLRIAARQYLKAMKLAVDSPNDPLAQVMVDNIGETLCLQREQLDLQAQLAAERAAHEKMKQAIAKVVADLEKDTGYVLATRVADQIRDLLPKPAQEPVSPGPTPHR